MVRPALSALKATVAPPAYTKRPPAPARDPARIEAWEDSRITLELAANKPLASVAVTWPAIAPEAGPDRTPLPPGEGGRRPGEGAGPEAATGASHSPLGPLSPQPSPWVERGLG